MYSILGSYQTVRRRTLKRPVQLITVQDTQALALEKFGTLAAIQEFVKSEVKGVSPKSKGWLNLHFPMLLGKATIYDSDTKDSLEDCLYVGLASGRLPFVLAKDQGS
jgi:hypothetical protein